MSVIVFLIALLPYLPNNTLEISMFDSPGLLILNNLTGPVWSPLPIILEVENTTVGFERNISLLNSLPFREFTVSATKINLNPLYFSEEKPITLLFSKRGYYDLNDLGLLFGRRLMGGNFLLTMNYRLVTPGIIWGTKRLRQLSLSFDRETSFKFFMMGYEAETSLNTEKFKLFKLEKKFLGSSIKLIYKDKQNWDDIGVLKISKKWDDYITYLNLMLFHNKPVVRLIYGSESSVNFNIGVIGTNSIHPTFYVETKSKQVNFSGRLDAIPYGGGEKIKLTSLREFKAVFSVSSFMGLSLSYDYFINPPPSYRDKNDFIECMTASLKLKFPLIFNINTHIDVHIREGVPGKLPFFNEASIYFSKTFSFKKRGIDGYIGGGGKIMGKFDGKYIYSLSSHVKLYLFNALLIEFRSIELFNRYYMLEGYPLRDYLYTLGVALLLWD